MTPPSFLDALTAISQSQTTGGPLLQPDWAQTPTTPSTQYTPSSAMSAAVSSRHPWTTPNKVLGGVSTALVLADWLQTVDAVRNPDAGGGLRHAENNPFLGRHPSVGQVNTMVPLGLGAILGLAHAMDSDKARNWLLGIFAGLEALNVARNASHGLKFNTNF